MNHIYRLVWSQLTQTWVAVAENARGHGKSISARKLVAAAAMLTGGGMLGSSALPAYAANAANATVVGGTGSVTQSGTTTTINQSSQRLAIDWSSLSTAANEALVFRQPNTSAIALNRITGSSPSTLLGSLTANGQVYILNPNGVLFGAGAQVNVGGLVASTLNMNAADFMNGSSTFTKDVIGSSSSVVNQGEINAANGGYVALLSGTVRNEGAINAPSGTALLAAGDKVTLNIDNGSLLGYTIAQGDLNALVENKQLIRADGGQVIMAAKALDKLSSAVINNTGVIEARTIQHQNGKILLLADMDVGLVNVAGKLDASAPSGGDGGFIETSAAQVKVADGTVVTTLSAQGLTGSWLIDPADYTVAASGGDITGATLSSNLATTDVQILSSAGTVNPAGNGDININDAVSWSSATKLTLSAQRNINVNKSITATNAAGKVALEYGLNAVKAGNTATYNIKAPINLLAGNNFSTKLGSDGATTQYTVVTSLGSAGSLTGTDLQGIRSNLSGNFVLGADIDASATASFSGGGFIPIGTIGAQFGGTFDGLGHVVSNLTINTGGQNYAGLFGYTSTSSNIRNVGLVGINVNGWGYVGALVGRNEGSITNSYTTGRAAAVGFLGGLVGYNVGTIDSSYTTATVSNPSTTFGDNTGGLVGANYGTISNSYATGNVTGGQLIGGLVGKSSFSALITNSYATGDVTSGSYSGGFVGGNYGTIQNSYSTGKITGGASTGAFAGTAGGTTTGSFWNITTSGTTVGSGRSFSNPNIATGITSVQASQLSTFKNAGWNIDGSGGTGTIWRFYDGVSGPLLRSFLTAITVTGSAADRTYDGTTSTGATYTSNIAGATLSGSLNYVTSKNAGTYTTAAGTLALTGLYSGQQGYDIIYSSTSYTINKANITLSSSNVTKTYDGTTAAAGAATLVAGNIISGDNFSGGSFAFTDKNAGTGNKTVTTSGVTINDGNGGNNYNVSYANNTTSTINKANVTLSASNVTKTYDGTTAASGTAVATVGSIFTGDSLSGGSFAFTDKNAGTGNKTVTTSGVTVNDGNGGNNYNVSYANNTTSTINKANVTLSASNVTKTYDGTTAASGAAVATVGSIFTGDSLSGGSFAFTDKNAGTGNKTVTTSGVIVNDGNGGNNYNVSYANNTTSTINQANLTLTAADITKTYDGTTAASGVAVVAGGTLFAGDSVSGGSFAFTDKNAGTGNKSVTTTGATVGDGVNNGNYRISYTNNTTSTINQANLTLTAADITKTYDGTTAASGVAVVAGGTLFSGDSVSGGSFAFTDKNAGTGNKSVTTSGATVGDGVNNSNYRISYTNNTTSTINQANLTLAAADITKTYDGTTAASGLAVVAGGTLFVGDSISGGSFAFTDKNAGTGNKSVTASGATVGDGVNNGNYRISYVDNTTSTINKANLTVTASAADKVYDGTTVAAVTYSDNRIAGDQLGYTAAASFADKNAGTGKNVNISAITLNGTDAANYNLTSSVANTSANITPAALTVTANASSKFADGRPYTGNSGITVAGLAGGDSLADLAGTLVYGGSASGATAMGSYRITPSGLHSANYLISFVDGVLTIRPLSRTSAALGGTALEQNYDGAQQGLTETWRQYNQQQAWHNEVQPRPPEVAQVGNGTRTNGVEQLTPRLSLVQAP